LAISQIRNLPSKRNARRAPAFLVPLFGWAATTHSGKRSGYGRRAHGDGNCARFGVQPVASASGQHESK
jgi:hypothetical protein